MEANAEEDAPSGEAETPTADADSRLRRDYHVSNGLENGRAATGVGNGVSHGGHEGNRVCFEQSPVVYEDSGEDGTPVDTSSAWSPDAYPSAAEEQAPPPHPTTSFGRRKSRISRQKSSGYSVEGGTFDWVTQNPPLKGLSMATLSSSDGETPKKYVAKSAYITGAASQELVYESPKDFRESMQRVVDSCVFDTMMGSVIFGNFILIVVETNHRANSDQEIPAYISALTWVCLATYTVELALRFVAHRLAVLESWWGVLDVVIVTVAFGEVIFDAFGIDIGSYGSLRIFRLARLLRLLRAVKLLGALRELRKLLEMMTSCLRTLFWSFLLCFAVMTIWSTVAVEILHDIVADMDREGVWSDCDVCGRYLSSVMYANLFQFQTIIAGDSWGKISVPVIERHPWAILIFGGALLTLVFGVLNLVVAVVVDTFADLRSKDMTHMATEMEFEELQEKKALYKIFEKIDADNSGELSYEELEIGAKRIPEFRHRLRVMDIDKSDLKHLFQMIDQDGSGEIDPEEFIETLYRVKNTESKTATKFIKHYVMNILPQIQSKQMNLEGNLESLQTMNSMMETSVHELKHRINHHEDNIKKALNDAMDNALHDAVKAAKGSITKELAAISDSMLAAVSQDHSTSLEDFVKGSAPPPPPPSSPVRRQLSRLDASTSEEGSQQAPDSGQAQGDRRVSIASSASDQKAARRVRKVPTLLRVVLGPHVMRKTDSEDSRLEEGRSGALSYIRSRLPGPRKITTTFASTFSREASPVDHETSGRSQPLTEVCQEPNDPSVAAAGPYSLPESPLRLDALQDSCVPPRLSEAMPPLRPREVPLARRSPNCPGSSDPSALSSLCAAVEHERQVRLLKQAALKLQVPHGASSHRAPTQSASGDLRERRVASSKFPAKARPTRQPQQPRPEDGMSSTCSLEVLGDFVAQAEEHCKKPPMKQVTRPAEDQPDVEKTASPYSMHSDVGG